MADRRRYITRILVAIGLLVVVAAVAGFGWYRASIIPVTEVRVTGAVHADVEQIVTLAAVPDSAMMFDLAPALVVEQVLREPWVHSAQVRRWMSGTLEISVQEREPVLLVLDALGRPASFVDADGFAMPVTPEALRAGYDLPLLAGAVAQFRPGTQVDDPALRRLVAALPAAGPAAHALISSFERRSDGQLLLMTAPTPAGASIPVWLGRDGFEEKLRRLEAFWEQAVLSHPDHFIRRIDLRFDGQIITEEAPRPVKVSAINNSSQS